MKCHYLRLTSSTLLLSLLLFSPVPARVVHVGSNPAADFNAIRAAIDDSQDGDIVIVMPGVYQGDGNRDIDFMGKAITVRSADPNDLGVVAATTIDCEGTETNPHRGFILQGDETQDMTVAGLTITNGYAGLGGAIYSYGSNLILRKCVIVGNTAKRGGGLYVDGGSQSASIENCIIAGNQAVADIGGGIYLSCLSARDGYLSYPTIRNCTIAENRARRNGGGLYAISGCFITLENTIIWHNSADWDVSLGMSNIADSANPCCLVSYSNVQGGPAGIRAYYRVVWETGNIEEKPLFAAPVYWDANGTRDNVNDDIFVTGDYHLKSQAGRWDLATESWVTDDLTSPCIDAGDPAIGFGQELATAPNDPNGLWSENTRINMGAYGGTAEASLAPVGFSSLVAAWNPEPEDSALIRSDKVVLSWRAMFSASCDVFFGPNEPEQMQYQGRQIETSFDPGRLAYEKTYYWRVDEIGQFGSIKGEVWHFRTRRRSIR